MSAGRARQPLYERIVHFLAITGAEVLSAHVARADVMQTEAELSAQAIFARDMNMIAGCDGLIAEVSTPSLGVGYEIATGLQQQRPILCLCEKDLFLTRILTGNTDPRLQVCFYANDAAWQSAIENFCRQLSRKDNSVTHS